MRDELEEASVSEQLVRRALVRCERQRAVCKLAILLLVPLAINQPTLLDGAIKQPTLLDGACEREPLGFNAAGRSALASSA